MKGTIRQYYSGNGWITGEDGEEYFLHYKNLLMKERLYKRGCTVTFDTEDQGGKHLCAVRVTVVPRDSRRVPTGHGRWVGTNIKGRYRCSDCNVTTDTVKPRFCPHCGAVMANAIPANHALDNDAERNNTKPSSSWSLVEYGYRCSNCQTVSKFPSKFCCRCGVKTQKAVRQSWVVLDEVVDYAKQA